MRENKYDDEKFFNKYKNMDRSKKGLAGAGAVSYTHLDVYKRQLQHGKRP